MIELSGIIHNILDIASFEIPKGYTCIAGENGSGKSTLLKLISGMEIAKKGSVLCCGENIRNLNSGYVPEYPDRQIIFDTCFDEIISPLRFSFADPKEAEEKTKKTADELGIYDILYKSCKKISGGEKAFLSLATALVTSPRILVLDEPDSHMDFLSAEKLFCAFKKLKPEYTIHCTQDMNIAEKADFLIFLEKGRVKYSGSPDDVFEKLKGTPFLPLSRRLF